MTSTKFEMKPLFTRQQLTRLSFVARGVQLLADGVEQKVVSREPEKTCPRCGRECWEPELARQVKAAGAAGVCTECALRAANTPGGGEQKK